MKAATVARIAIAFWAGTAFAQVKDAIQEDFRATLDSPFIQRVLAQRFPEDPKGSSLAIATLRASGNLREAELLERARKRVILARMTGEPVSLPSTAGEAIAREPSAPDFQEALVQAARRVTVKPAGPPELTVGPNGTSDVYLNVSAHNGLPVALRRLGLRVQPGIESLPCDVDGSGGAWAPEETRTLRCHSYGPEERMRGLADSLARGTATLYVFYAGTVDSTLTLETVIFEDRVGSAAHEALVAASCQDKGTCAEVKHAREAIASEEARQRRPSENAATRIAVAVLLAVLAAVFTRPTPDAGWVLSLLALAVTAFAAFAAAALYFGQVPHASVIWMLGFVILYYGALPFLVALGVLIASLVSGRRTRLRVFSATFGAAMAILTAATLFAYR